MSYLNHSDTLRLRAARLTEIADYPDCAYISAVDAAALLDTSPGVLANWRSRKVGPRFVRFRDSIRYQMGALKAFAEGRDRLEWDAQPAGSKLQDAPSAELSTA
jgi:hypothetical protein